MITAIIAALAVLALIPATIAHRKGHPFMTWYMYGLVAWIVAVPFAIMANDARPKCPDCREPVDPQAVRCPHCQADINGRVVTSVAKKPFSVTPG